MNNDRLTAQQAADLVGVTHTTIRRWLGAGELSPHPDSIADPDGGWLRLYVGAPELRTHVARRVIGGRWKRYDDDGDPKLPREFLRGLDTVSWGLLLAAVAVNWRNTQPPITDADFRLLMVDRVFRAFGSTIAGGMDARLHTLAVRKETPK